MQNRPTLAQRQFARHLRTSQTDCEQLLWQKLRSRQVAGLKFRRQERFMTAAYGLSSAAGD